MISLFTGSTCAPIADLASRSLAFHAGCDSRKDVLAVLAARLEGRLRGRDIGDLVPFRRNGFSLDQEEFHDAMVAIAVPVKDPQGRFYAALAVHGPTQRFGIDAALANRDLLHDYAARISQVIFGDGPDHPA